MGFWDDLLASQAQGAVNPNLNPDKVKQFEAGFRGEAAPEENPWQTNWERQALALRKQPKNNGVWNKLAEFFVNRPIK